MGRWTDIAVWGGTAADNFGDGDWTAGEASDRMLEQRGVVVHIAEGSESGTIAWERNPDSDISSHFVVGLDGAITQMVDTDDYSWCQSAGNRGWLSVENAGYSGRPLTAVQIEANARILAKAHQVYGVPLQATDSTAGRGLGWHGMGGADWGSHFSCLPLDVTDVLTPDGWLPLANVTDETLVASYAADSGIITFDRPVAVIEPYLADTITVAGMEMTEDHRLYVHRSDCTSRKVIEARDLEGKRTNWLAPSFGSLATTGAGVGQALMRLLVWVQADGHYQMKDGRLDHLHFHFRKERKVGRVTDVLEALGRGYRVSRRADGTTVIKLYGVDWLREHVMKWLPEKRWEPWLLNCDDEEFAAFDEEVTFADGTDTGSQRFYFSSIGRNADLVQALYVTHGRSASIYDVGSQIIVNLHTGRASGVALRDRFGSGRRDVRVGCLTTVNDTILIRQSGQVMVVGNCPGTPIRAQFPAIVARATEIANGGDDMKQDEREWLAHCVEVLGALETGDPLMWTKKRVKAQDQLNTLAGQVAEVAAAVKRLGSPSVDDAQVAGLAERIGAALAPAMSAAAEAAVRKVLGEADGR